MPFVNFARFWNFSSGKQGPHALVQVLEWALYLVGTRAPSCVQLTPLHTLIGLIWGNTEAVSSHSGILRPDIISLYGLSCQWCGGE